MCIRDSVGAGLGKAAEIPEAIRKGKEDAIKSMVNVKLDENNSIDVYKRQVRCNKNLQRTWKRREEIRRKIRFIERRFHPCLLYTSRCV